VNQITDSESPERAYTFDDDGNMTQGYTPEGYVFDATYDAENRLIFLEYTDSGSILHRTEYTYGGDNLLYQIRKLEDGVETDLRRIIRAGFLPIQERDGNNNVVREYVWGIDMGGGIGGLLAIKESGADYYYLYDGKGNVTAITDASGTVVATYSYDPFGVLMEKTGTLDQPFRFSTKRYDEDTGLSYYGYRFYSASLGRWITRDPLGEAGGINLYGFVGNNAVNWIDPLGLFSPSDKGLEEFDDYTSTIKTCSDAVTAPTAADANVECIQCGNAINQYKWLTVSPWSSICMYTWCQNNPDIAGTDSFCTTFVKEKK
jgi:RHS repeat-associated protein